MSSPHRRAVAAEAARSDFVGKLFDRVGTTKAPRGFVLSAYRTAGRAMQTALGESNPVLAAVDVMDGLRNAIQSGARSVFTDASAMGSEEAARQMRFYRLKVGAAVSVVDRAAVDAAIAALAASVDAQDAALRAMLLAGVETQIILGDYQRKGLLRSADVAALAAGMAASLLWSAFGNQVNRNNQERPFQKQVVAALDERTTDCYLQAHGQVRPLDQAFHLTGTPRYADHMDWSPFHGWCRTAIALYRPEHDDGMTGEMQAGADQILKERAAGGSGYRHPADAYG